MYGVLKSSINTGLDSELLYTFSTPLRITSNQPAYVSDTMNLKRKVSSQNVQRWEIEAEIAQTNDSPDSLIHSVLNGHINVFYIRMPQVYTPNKIVNDLNITTQNLMPIGTTSLSLLGVGSVDLKGQFINFEGNSKVYLITNGGSGGLNVEIAPALITEVAAATSVIYGDKTTMYARYDTDTILGINYSDGILVNQGTQKFIEAL